MSTKFERQLESFLFFGGDMPNLADGVKEVPRPIVPKHIPEKERIPVKVKCGWYGDKFVHFDNCTCDWGGIHESTH